MASHDLIVIGTGSAASQVARRCRAAAWSVAVVDSRPYGGTCALRGCDPKKVLVGAADLVDWRRRMADKGVRGGDLGIDWRELMAFKRTFTEPVPQSRANGLRELGIETLHGRARFVGDHSLDVDGSPVEAERVVIASGAEPAPLGFPGEDLLTTSEEFLELDDLPSEMVFVGGGYISFEFAHVVARAGARATIVHRGVRPLVGFDPDLVGRLVERTRDLGVPVQLGTEVTGIARSGERVVVTARSGGQEREFDAQLVVHGAGRIPELDDLDLPRAGVEREKNGVVVTEYLQSVSNPAVYAAGDAAATGAMPLTPVATLEGRVVAANLLDGNHQTPDYTAIPTVVFTIPPLARVGLLEAEAREQGVRYEAHFGDTAGWYSSRRVGETCSAFKVLVEQGSGRIVGAHLLGPGAEDVVNVFGLAVRMGLSADDLKAARFAYPTHASDIGSMLG